MFLEKDRHALGKGLCAAGVHKQFWKEKKIAAAAAAAAG